MKKLILYSFMALAALNTEAQAKYSTKAGKIIFDAGTGLEDITGTNKSVTTVIDGATGAIQFSLLIKGFEFKSQLMQDHFNENYMESEKFPKAKFKGKLNMDKVNLSKDGTYKTKVKGTLEIHGESKDVETDAELVVKGEDIKATADITITLEDYKINIPSVVKDKLSKTAKITIDCKYSIIK